MPNHPGSVADPPPPPTVLAGRRQWWVLGLLAAAQFMLILDVTVVNVALPDLAAGLRLSRVEATWAVTAYTTTFGALLLLGGRVTDAIGARRTALSGLALFTAATALTGAAPNAVSLLTGRVAQGVGAALLSPAALSIVMTLFTGPQRRRALAVWGALGGTGSAVGVLLGGALTAGPGWRWVFFINLPVGIVVLTALPALLPAGVAVAHRQRLDLTGATLATGGTAALIYALVASGQHGWSSPTTLVPVGAAIVLYAAFLTVERRVSHPLVDLAGLAARPLVAGSILMLLATGLLVGGFFLGSFSLQRLHGLTALRTGLLFLPVAVATIAGAHLGSRAVATVGSRWSATAGLVIACGGALVATRQGTGWLVTGLAITALGAGACLVTALNTALAEVPAERAGVTSGLVNSFHEIGGGVGVAVSSSVAAASITGLTGSGFGHAFTVNAVAALAAAVVMAVVIPPGRATAAVPLAH